jgi:hypothetical protein
MLAASEAMKPGALCGVQYAHCVFRLPSAGVRLVQCQLPLSGRGRSTESFLVAYGRRITSSPHTGHQDIKPITSMVKEKKREKVIVVGAGPVGSLAALYAANRGNDVEVYELRGGKSRNYRQSFIAFSVMISGTRIFGCFTNKRLLYFRELRFLQACSTCLIGLEVTKLPST